MSKKQPKPGAALGGILRMQEAIAAEVQAAAKGGVTEPKWSALQALLDRIGSTPDVAADETKAAMDYMLTAAAQLDERANEVAFEAMLFQEGAQALLRQMIGAMTEKGLERVSGTNWHLIRRRLEPELVINLQVLEAEAPEFITRQSAPLLDRERLTQALKEGRKFSGVSPKEQYELACEPVKTKQEGVQE